MSKALREDIIIILFGVLIAFFIGKLSIFDFGFYESNLLNIGFLIALTFFAGIFFTSVFTIAPAAIFLAKLAEILPLPIVVVVGGLGAMIGDYILFFFIKDRFSLHLQRALKKTHWKKIFKSFHFGFLKWLSPIAGAMIIASPLPDELGIMLMGISKVRTSLFLAITLLMNMLGILFIVSLSSVF